MVADVLLALAQSASIELTIVVTCEPSLPETAREHGALLIEDTAEQGQSEAVTLGVQRALADGFERVLCIPGDCPALDPGELDALLSRAEQRSVVIVPDRHGAGTNGLLLDPARRDRTQRSAPAAASATARSRALPAWTAAWRTPPRCCSTSTPAPTWPPCATVWPAPTRPPSELGRYSRSPRAILKSSPRTTSAERGPRWQASAPEPSLACPSCAPATTSRR